MSRIRIVLGGVAVVLGAVGVAVPALASQPAEKPQVNEAPQIQQPPASDLKPGEKWPGDPYVGKCVYWLKGDTQLRSCDR